MRVLCRACCSHSTPAVDFHSGQDAAGVVVLKLEARNPLSPSPSQSKPPWHHSSRVGGAYERAAVQHTSQESSDCHDGACKGWALHVSSCQLVTAAESLVVTKEITDWSTALCVRPYLRPCSLQTAPVVLQNTAHTAGGSQWQHGPRSRERAECPCEVCSTCRPGRESGSSIRRELVLQGPDSRLCGLLHWCCR